MHLKEIKHYHAVSDYIASSGQPLANQFAAIAEAGYQKVINLAMPDSANAIENEDRIVAGLNMTYVHLPVPFDTPTVRHLQSFFNVMQHDVEQKIWVHCALNYRVSAFLYHYHRFVLKQSEAEAKKVMLPSWEPNPTWQQFLRISVDDVKLQP